MFPLSSNEKRFLLGLARQSLESAVCGRTMETPGEVAAAVARPAGAFVSLHTAGALRGCVGFITAARPLYLTVMEAAAAAALHDMRFLPVAAHELAALDVEISVLSAPREARAEEIQIGFHGLMLTRGMARGVLLPQVAVDHRWTALQFLEETCKKAGLPREAWRNGTRIEVFTAEIFGERG